MDMNNPDEGDKSSGTDGNDGGRVKSDSNDAQEGIMRTTSNDPGVAPKAVKSYK